MTAAGDAVLAEARRWIGTTEQPPGSNGGPWWDNFGGNYGSWCAAFVSMVVNNALGYPSMCQIDSSAGFMLVSNGVYHEYVEPNGASATGLEAQRTADLQPGDVVMYSWESWRWEGTPGQGGYPVCDGGAYDGWTAGDHTGIAASGVDSAGYFRAVEGNTSDTDSGSQDNGGGCYEKTRHISQVCGWQRPVAYGGALTPPPEEDWLSALTDQQQTELYSMVNAIFWMVGNQMPSAEGGATTIAARVAEIRRYAESTYWMVGNQDPQAGVETVASDARAARQNTDRLVEGG